MIMQTTCSVQYARITRDELRSVLNRGGVRGNAGIYWKNYMKNDLDIIKLSIFIHGRIAELAVTNEIWILFGYKKIPKRGSIIFSMLPKNYRIFEKFIFREVYTVSAALSFLALKKYLADKWTAATLVYFLYYSCFDSLMYRSLGFSGFDEALSHFQREMSEYMKADLSDWKHIFIKHIPQAIDKKYIARLLLGCVQFFSLIEDCLNLNQDVFRELLEGRELSGNVEIRSEYAVYEKIRSATNLIIASIPTPSSLSETMHEEPT